MTTAHITAHTTRHPSSVNEVPLDAILRPSCFFAELAARLSCKYIHRDFDIKKQKDCIHETTRNGTKESRMSSMFLFCLLTSGFWLLLFHS